MRKPNISFLQRLKRIDSNLDCRWSYERGQWVVVAKVVGGNTDGLMPPVRMVKVDNKIVEKPMPELSERAINYKEKTYPLFYFHKYPDESIIREIKRMDCAKYKKNEDFLRNIEENERIEAEKKARHESNLSEAIANDIYDTAMRRCGERSFGDGPVSDSRWY